MQKHRRRSVLHDPAKQTRLRHSFTLTLLALALSVTLLSGLTLAQTPQANRSGEILSYEGQTISSVDLAGRPDLRLEDFGSVVKIHAGDPFSAAAVEATLAGLKSTGRFEDVQLDFRPEQEGVRVMFIAQPAVYFGIYRFPGAESFSYARLLQISNYAPQEPFSRVNLEKATEGLLNFFQQNGYFRAQVDPQVRTDQANGIANIDFQVSLNQIARFGDVIVSGTNPEHSQQLEDIVSSLRARFHLAAVREGKKYSLKTLQNATDYLEGRLVGQNYLGAQARLLGASYDAESNRADITFDVNPGPIVHGTITGAHLWSWTKHSLLPIYQEAGVTPELIQEGRQNLLNYFREKGYFDVEVETELNIEPPGETDFYRITKQDVQYRINKGEKKKIERVTFTGNQHFDEKELIHHVSVQTAGFLTSGHYDEKSVKTLEAFYQSNGFNSVRVTPQFPNKDNNVTVNFLIQEGPQDTVETFRVEGNNRIPLNELAPDGLRLGEGKPYSQKSVDEDRNKLMSRYLEQGFLTATFDAQSQPSAEDPHKFTVAYVINEGPQVKTKKVVTLGPQVTDEMLIQRDTTGLQTGQPLTEREIMQSETRLYTTGVFDWAEVNPRRQITTQDQEDVVVKVHEAKRNSITYGFGFEFVNRGGSVPTGTVALPGLPPVGLPSTFSTSQRSFKGPRANFQYTRSNVRGKAETFAIGGLAGPLDRRASAVYTDPNFRWTRWAASLSATAEYNKENPIFTSRQAQVGFQLQRPIGEGRTQNVFVRYSFSETGLIDLLIPALVPAADLHTRLSTLAAVYIRDTRDNPLDAHSGIYESFEFDVNPSKLGSSVNFAKLLAQTSYYRRVHNDVVWANSLRIGLEAASSKSHVPLSQKFFTGGGSTLRGFPLNGAGPQSTIPACGDASNPSSCSFIRVPTGGPQLMILNSELRFPVPLKKGTGLTHYIIPDTLVTFYDGGNVFDRIGFKNFGQNYTNSVGIGLRYATPVGPVRLDIGHNLNAVTGIKATQIFITLGQAF